MEHKEKIHNMASCMLSILDSLKLFDNDSLYLEDETLSEIMFRKMEAYDIDLNKELGFTHLEPVRKSDQKKNKLYDTLKALIKAYSSLEMIAINELYTLMSAFAGEYGVEYDIKLHNKLLTEIRKEKS